MITEPDFDYSLAKFEHPSDKSEHIKSFIEDYICRYELFEYVKRYVGLAWHFTRFCSPKGASLEALNACGRYLAIFFFIDDQPSDCHKRFQDILLSAKTPQTKADKAFVELLESVERLAKLHQIRSDPFRQHLLDFIAAQQWERNMDGNEERYFTPENYWWYAQITVANLPYLALLKLAKNVDEYRFNLLQRSRLMLLEQLCTRIIRLDNDIYSWQEERDEPTALNLVKILKEKSALSWEDSLEQVFKRRNAAIESYIFNRDDVLNEQNTDELQRYVELIEHLITGNLKAHKTVRAANELRRYIGSSEALY